MDREFEPAAHCEAEDESGLHVRPPNAAEARYMQGDAEPATSSVLISNSKYLNSPLYRDAFAQTALRRHGHDLPETYMIPYFGRAIAEVKDVPEFIRLIEEEKRLNPAFAAWLGRRREARYLPGTMGGYRPGTLGARIRAFVEESGLNMEFALQDEVKTDIAYMQKRRASTHDIEHMVTGFGPNELGEDALAICNVTATARYFSPGLAHHINDHPLFWSVCSYKRISLHYPALLPDHMEAMRLGIVAGQALKQPLFMYDWEDYLDRTPEDICEELGIVRGPEEAWKDSSARATG
jgi:hypothetical protein